MIVNLDIKGTCSDWLSWLVNTVNVREPTNQDANLKVQHFCLVVYHFQVPTQV